MAAAKKKSTGGGASAFALMVGDEGAILVQMQRKRVVRRVFAQSPDPSHTRAMEEALSASPRAPITVLVDMMDQSYVQQTLPPVSKLSVAKIVRRRMDKDFSADDIKGYLILDREKTGRRDWNYLMVSLANSPLLQKWIAYVVERSNPLRGIGLVPMETQSFLQSLAKALLKKGDKLAQPLEWQMLVNHHKVGGFRQIVLRGGKLAFTRMAQPIGESSPAVIAGNIEQEIINTLEYLKRMGLQDPSVLSVTIIGSDDIRQALDPKKIKSGEYHFFTPFEIAGLLSLTDAAQPEDQFGDVIVSAFIVNRRSLLLALYTAYTTKLKNLTFFLKGTRITGVLAALALLAWSGMSFFDISSLKDDMDTLQSKQVSLKNTLADTKKQAQALPASIDMIMDTLTMVQALDKRHYDALMFVTGFAGTLQEAALVQDYHWSLSDPLGTAKDSDKRQQTADIKVRLTLPHTPKEKYVAGAQGFIERIKRDFADYTLTHSELPGLLSDTQALKTTLNAVGGEAPGIVDAASDSVTINIKGPAGKHGH